MDERERLRREMGAQNREGVQRRRPVPKGSLSPPPSMGQRGRPPAAEGAPGQVDTRARLEEARRLAGMLHAGLQAIGPDLPELLRHPAQLAAVDAEALERTLSRLLAHLRR